MNVFKNIILSVSLVLLSGCVTLPDHSNKNDYEKNYRQEVKEQVKQVAYEFQGGNFPYYHWSSPIVQEVVVPAHLTNGAMIPEHKELVIIKPGEWVTNQAYPIQTQQRNKNENKIAYMDVGDLTVLPKSMEHADNTRKEEDNN